MKNKNIVLISLCLFSGLTIAAQNKTLIPITTRVDIQGSVAPQTSVIDGEWVAVGSKKEHAIQYDYTRTFNGKPSYRFELKQNDNTLSGYNVGETKGRAELSYCYATKEHIKNLSAEQLEYAIRAKKVYHYGKGECPQGSTKHYQFSIYVPSELDASVNTIFAQWHGMPDRTLLKTPEGVIKQVSDKEFSQIWEKVIFKKDTGYDKIAVTNANGSPKLDKNGNPVYKAGKKPNGWIVEQGGYPPLAFGFNKGFFYIKANSDRKWLTDKSDRCNIDPEKGEVMKPLTSKYKASTLAFKEPFSDFPKNTWVTFNITINWTIDVAKNENILKPGALDVIMSYDKNGEKIDRHIVNNEQILIGRNDENGYYFKFGIYRVGNSTVPVCYNLAGYKEY